jgi:hypothetical protein
MTEQKGNERRLQMIAPEILSVPVFSMLDGGAVPWPTIGAVLVWMLIAAVVGIALGFLRENLRGTEPTPVARKKMGESHVGATAHGCCEAA